SSSSTVDSDEDWLHSVGVKPHLTLPAELLVRALDDFIHFGVHLHAALSGDGLAELQIVEALGGHEAALSLPPGAARSWGSADRVTIDVDWWKRGQEPLHPGAMKPVQVLPAEIYTLAFLKH
uniref:Uncharacterized protein n=1 Tax=Seriola dumerili TaxID=41447 RepID=A0A3B4UPF0_SERDU